MNSSFFDRNAMETNITTTEEMNMGHMGNMKIS